MHTASTQADYELIRDPSTGLREAYDRAGYARFAVGLDTHRLVKERV